MFETAMPFRSRSLRLSCVVAIGASIPLVLACCGQSEPEGKKLRDENMAGVYLAGVDYRNSDLRGADLSFAILDGADLRGAALDRANLAGASLSDARLEGATGLNDEQLADVLYERGRPPRVDDRYRTAIEAAAPNPSDTIVEPATAEAFAGVVTFAGPSASKLSIEYRGPSLAMGPAGSDDGLREIVRLQARIRAATRRAIRALAEAVGSTVTETFEGEGQDVVLLRCDQRERRLDPILEFARVAFEGSDDRARPVLAKWSAPSILDLSARLVMRGYRIAMLGDVDRHTKMRAAFERLGHEVVLDAGRDDLDAVLVLAPRSDVDTARLRALQALGVASMLVLPHDTSSAIQSSFDPLLTSAGLRIEDKPLRSGSRDPMSGETTFGERTDRVDVIGDAFGDALLVTERLRVGEAIVELRDVSAIMPSTPNAVGDKKLLLSSPPYGWLGSADDKPDDKSALKSYSIAWLVPGSDATRRAGGGTAGMIVLGANAFSDDSIHVGTTNLDLGVALTEWLVTH